MGPANGIPIWRTPATPGVWHILARHIHFDSDARKGFSEVWYAKRGLDGTTRQRLIRQVIGGDGGVPLTRRRYYATSDPLHNWNGTPNHPGPHELSHGQYVARSALEFSLYFARHRVYDGANPVQQLTRITTACVEPTGSTYWQPLPSRDVVESATMVGRRTDTVTGSTPTLAPFLRLGIDLTAASATRLRVVMLINRMKRGAGAERTMVMLATHLPRDRFEVTVATDASRRRASRGDVGAPKASGHVALDRRSRFDVAQCAALPPSCAASASTWCTPTCSARIWGTVLGRLAGVPAVVAHEHSWSYEGQPVRRFIDGSRHRPSGRCVRCVRTATATG